jgi:hypothetical protein
MEGRTSEDFLEFSTDDLIEEIARRSVTLVAAIEVEGEGVEGEDYPNRFKFLHSGDPFARTGLCDLLLTHIRRENRVFLDYME